MPDETTHYPLLGELLAADPYPFHGLVVRYTGSNIPRLRPHDGRPEVDLKPWNVGLSSRLPDYVSTPAGVLWDIGRPDPPVTPLVYARGGTSLGRRILNPEIQPRLPARLDGVTRHVLVYLDGFFPQVTSVAQVKMNVAGVTSVIGTIDIAGDFGGSPSQLHPEGGSGDISFADPIRWRAGARLLDASPDGSRRLFALFLRHEISSSFLAESAIVGIFEVLLSAEDGVVSGEIVIKKTATECLGIYTRSGSNDLYSEGWESFGSVEEGAVCGSRSFLIPAVITTPMIVAGTTTYTHGRQGMVMGASYVDGQIEYHTSDYLYSITRTAGWTRPDLVGEGNGTSCLIPSTIPHATSVQTVNRRSEITLHINGRTITAVREYSGGLTQEKTSTTVINTYGGWGVDSLGGLTRTDTIGEGATLDFVVDESPPYALGTFPSTLWGGSFLVSWRRRWSAIAARWGDNWAQGPMIHENGTLGEWVVTTLATSAPIDSINRCAACPITGNAVRAVDLPGVLDVSYI